MKEILDGVFAIDMFEKIDIDVIMKNNECFFVCDVVDDVDFIKALAKFLNKEGARRMSFFGKHAQLWENTFDMVNIELIGYQRLSAMMFDDITTTAILQEFDEFTNQIDVSHGFFKRNVYIFYDDKQIFENILKDIHNWEK